ncbi:ATP-binding protein [Streptomyces olivaceoviridis]|uniref:ATP-binding protein n=1 Tax=Streptomyces olivaceoviridis TaxID=1921 RepID=UPI003326703F
MAVLLCAGVLIAADRWAIRTADLLHRRRVKAEEGTQQRLAHLTTLAEQQDKSLRLVVEQVNRGEVPPAPAVPPTAAVHAGGPWGDLEDTLWRSHALAVHSVLTRHQANANLSQVFLYLAGTLFTLVVRALGIMARLTSTMEDPDTLYDLLDIDSLLRRIRRHGARFAVLGGQRARQVDTPLRLLDLLRGGVAEVERFDQVRISTPKADVQLPAGTAGPDVMHLLAELIENATKSSSPQHKVIVRTSEVQAGLLIEVEDRGAGLSDDQLLYFNRVLASPRDSDVTQRLRERQTGLLVVSRLAARYKIRVELQRNFFGGTTAYVVIPQALLQQAGALQPPRTVSPAPASRPGSPSKRPAGGPRPSSAVITGEGTLPYRRAQRPVPAVPAVDGQRPRQETKPSLPRRTRQAPAEPSPPQPTLAERSATEGTVRPDFFANLSAAFSGSAAEDITVQQPPAEGSPPRAES